jgi:hypothetical protein
MGSKVCGLCIHYHVWVWKDYLGNKWDACTFEDPKKVYSLQKACEYYQTAEPINVKEKEAEKTTKKTGKGKSSKEG